MLDLHQNVCISVPYVVHAVNSLAIYSYFTTPSSVRVDYVVRSTIFYIAAYIGTVSGLLLGSDNLVACLQALYYNRKFYNYYRDKFMVLYFLPIAQNTAVYKTVRDFFLQRCIMLVYVCAHI